jgi:hypothetical protein
MSQLFRVIFVSIAASLTLGAVGFAFARDLTAGAGDPATTEAAVNRAAKNDRAASAAPAAEMRTVLLRLDSLPNTSVLIRLPVAREAHSGPTTPSLIGSGARKMTVACEPVVSVLTEIARKLQPGRCVT